MWSIVVLGAFAFPVLANNLRGTDISQSKMPLLIDSSPKLSECLLSAVSEDDCGAAVEGCIWCAEPIYGLCLTHSAAQKVGWMPFFSCTFPGGHDGTLDAGRAMMTEQLEDSKIRIA